MKKSLSKNASAISLLLSCAFEGGSNYWYLIDEFPFNCDPERMNPDGTIDFGNDRYDKIATGRKFEIKFWDINSDDVSSEDTIIGRLTPKSRSNAWRMLRDEYPEIYARAMTGDADADDGDVFLQLAVMGEEVFS